MDQRSSVFIKRGDKVIGPMSWAKAVALAKQRKLQKADLIGPDSLGPWTAAGAALSEYLKLPVAAVVQLELGTTAQPVGVAQRKVALSPMPADAVLPGAVSGINARALIVSLVATCAILAGGVALVVKLRSSTVREAEIAQNRQQEAHQSDGPTERGIERDALALATSKAPESMAGESGSGWQAGERTEPEPAQPDTSMSLEEIEDLTKLLERVGKRSETKSDPPSTTPADAANRRRRRPGPDAIYERALQLIRGEGVAKDVPLGFKRMERAAELGHVEAMKFVSVMYHEGMGTAIDLGASAYWMLKAAEAGDAEAMWGISNMYWKGEGVQQDERIAVYWVQRSAALKHQPAVEWLVEYRAVSVLNLFAGASGGTDDDADAYADRSEAQRRVSREYWESRAQREAAAGDFQAAEASRRMNQ